MEKGSPFRFPLMGLGLVALLLGLWAGLRRLGWAFPQPHPALFQVHGPLMVSGFLGTLISLERAVALGRPWAYLAPLLSGLGGVAMILQPQSRLGPAFLVWGSLVLVAILAVIFRRQPALFTATLGGGALVWAGGNLLWLMDWPTASGMVFAAAFWWMGFLVLTIAGERLELSRLTRPPKVAQGLFGLGLGLMGLGLLLTAGAFGGPMRERGWTAPLFDGGVRLMGGGMGALALWLWRFDIARYTVRQKGLTRFVALCLLSGYGWLGLGGLLGILLGGVMSGPDYDALLHAIFLGFVFAMVFGHAPIIFPALLGTPLPFRPAFYSHLLLLHLSLMVRLMGDLGDFLLARQWGGLLNAAAVLLFLLNTSGTILSSLIPRRR